MTMRLLRRLFNVVCVYVHLSKDNGSLPDGITWNNLQCVVLHPIKKDREHFQKSSTLRLLSVTCQSFNCEFFTLAVSSLSHILHTPGFKYP
jgi:hypothetical protein